MTVSFSVEIVDNEDLELLQELIGISEEFIAHFFEGALRKYFDDVRGR